MHSLLMFLRFCWVVFWVVPRPDAGYFSLVGKVTKTPLKPLRFQSSRFYEGSSHPLRTSLCGTCSLKWLCVCPARPLPWQQNQRSAF